MEIFLPSVLIVILAAVIVFTVLPRFGPLVLTLISLGLLSFGVYHHWSLFKREYTDATWYDSMTVKFLAPALLIGITFVFILGFILSFFGSGVPVPAIPEVTEAVNNVANNVAENATNVVENITNTVRMLAEQATNTVTGAVGIGNANRRNNAAAAAAAPVAANANNKAKNAGIANALKNFGLNFGRNKKNTGSPATNIP